MNSLRDELYNRTWSPHHQRYAWYQRDHWPTGDTQDLPPHPK